MTGGDGMRLKMGCPSGVNGTPGAQLLLYEHLSPDVVVACLGQQWSSSRVIPYRYFIIAQK